MHPPENYLLLFIVILAVGCTMPAILTQQGVEPMKKPVFLQTDKKTYSSGETITIELHNNSGKPVFVMNQDSRYSRFLIVQKQEDETFDQLNAPYLFDPSRLATADIGLPEPVEIPPGKTVLGQWNGTAFNYLPNGKIQATKPKGIFKAILSEGYAFEISPLQNGYFELKNQVRPLESNEFEIK